MADGIGNGPSELDRCSRSAEEPREWTTAFLRTFCQVWSRFHFFGFRNNNFLQSKVVRLASNPQPALCIYVPQWQGGSVIAPGTRFPFHRLLWLAGRRWRYINQLPHEMNTIHLHRSLLQCRFGYSFLCLTVDSSEIQGNVNSHAKKKARCT
jgi:hypothetical protein